MFVFQSPGTRPPVRAWSFHNQSGVTVSTRLIFLRHGQSTSNVLGIATSALEGYPLTEDGRAQASAAAKQVSSAGATHVYVSPILRARQTGQIVADRNGLPLSPVPGLEEINVGVLEGLSEENAKISAVSNFQRWLQDDELDHGFEGGETGRSAAERMSAALTTLVRSHGAGTAIVVSHGGVLALGLLQLCDNLSGAFLYSHILDNCARVDVVIESGRWRCLTWAGVRPERGGVEAVA
jgi:broad specificity phosphatase PhoE